jgi:pimeloyl-ACP methyl ester carboxylesterase
VPRPVTPDGAATFPLAAVRTGPRGRTPLLVLPGGPGLASVLLYRSLRRAAAAAGFDVVMVEHRGVGLSRLDAAGADLPLAAMTVEQVVDDLAAVLDDAGIERAVVYGTSYGGYLAQAFGARHPDRVAGMVLDSTGLSADDVEVARRHLRRVLRDGDGPGPRLLRELLDRGPDPGIAHVVPLVHEFAGPDALERLLELRSRGRAGRTWRWLAGLGAAEIEGGARFVAEPDLVAPITYDELGWAAPPDGDPLDPVLPYAGPAARYRAAHPLHGERFDLRAALPGFAWPVAVMSGERDLRAPRPLAEEIVALAPDAVLVPLRDSGHSALDTHRRAALVVAAAVAAGTHHRLPALADRIAALPRRGSSAALGPVVRARIALAAATG